MRRTRSPARFAMRTAASGWAPCPRAAGWCAQGAFRERPRPMIGRILGELVQHNPPQVIVVTHGVGYEIDVPMSTFYHLPRTGENVTLLTHMVVREDAHLLYGFLTPGERTAFRQLLKISGVGPNVALSVLSGLSVDDLAAALASQDAARLTKVPRLRKQPHQRLVLQLPDPLPLPVGRARPHPSPP